MEATIAPSRETICLRQPRKQAMQELANQLKIGQAIANQRIRDRWALDQARSEKQEWVSRVSASLTMLFSSPRVCERFNDWPARILPEYAELDAFITMFGQEMKHRLGRLQNIVSHLPDVPESAADSDSTPDDELPNASAPTGDLASEGPCDITAASSGSSVPASPASHQEMALDCADDVDEPVVTLVDEDQPLPVDTADFSDSPTIAQPTTQPREAPMILTPRQSTPPATPAPAPAVVGTPIIAETTILLLAGAPEQPAVGPLRHFLEMMGLKLDLVHCPPGGVIHGLDGRSPRVSFALILLEGPAVRPEGDHLPELGQRLFDLGYCVGKVGAGSVCAIHDSGESHVDALGITHLAMDRSDGWQLQLGRLLRKSGMNVDLNRLA